MDTGVSSPDLARRREAYRRHLERRLTECGVPAHVHRGLVEYLTARRPPGRFLSAILTNNLRDAAVRADDVNRFHLFEVVQFLVNYAPSIAWGSATVVEAWLTDPEDPPMVFE